MSVPIPMTGSWEHETIGTGNGKIYDMVISDGSNSGSEAIYAACEDRHIYQLKYENGQWNKLDIGSGGTPLYKLAVGDGDNDNQFEIYAVGENNHVYQFKASTMAPTPIPDFQGKIISKNYIYTAPNPVRGHFANIIIFTNQPAEVSAKLFTTSNKEVISFRRYYGSGKNIEKINISNLANGVYILLVKAKSSDGTEERVIKKIAIVK